MEIEARTASSIGPSRSQISRPDLEIGRYRREGSAVAGDRGRYLQLAQQCDDLLAGPPPDSRTSSMRAISRQVRDCAKSLQSRQLASYIRSADQSPIEHPHTMSGSMPASASASMIPMCDHPRAEPLPSARPMRGLAIGIAPRGIHRGERRNSTHDMAPSSRAILTSINVALLQLRSFESGVQEGFGTLGNSNITLAETRLQIRQMFNRRSDA